MSHTTIHRSTLLSLTAALVLALPLAAQNPYPDPDDVGLVMSVHTETYELHPEPTSPEAAQAITRALSDPTFLAYYGIVRIYGGALLGYADPGYCQEQEEYGYDDPRYDELCPDDPEGESSLDYTIYLKDDRMRVDMGGSSLLARLAPDGSVLEWGVLDPGSGRVIESDFFDRALRERSTEPYDPASGTGQNAVLVVEEDPTPTNVTDSIVGHLVRRYDYTYELELYPFGRDAGEEEIVIKLETAGQAWIAEEGPYADDPDAARVFQSFVQSGPSTVAQLAERGLLLGVSETSKVDAGLSVLVAEASSSFEVTDISRQVVDDALLAGFEREGQECSCSCVTFWKLQAIGELSKAEQEAHPEAMSISMCAPKCAMQWASCGEAPSPPE